MAKPSGTIQPELTEQDYEYAKMLLSWGRSLDEKITRLEDYEVWYWHNQGRG